MASVLFFVVDITISDLLLEAISVDFFVLLDWVIFVFVLFLADAVEVFLSFVFSETPLDSFRELPILSLLPFLIWLIDSNSATPIWFFCAIV